jgi:predicted TIM-barrel fold metal-dependent hydrolase
MLEHLASVATPPAAFADELRAGLARATRNAVGVKTILAYRCGFAVDLARPPDAAVRTAYEDWVRDLGAGPARVTDPVLIAFAIHEALDLGMPVQIHAGLGDRDIDLAAANPLLLTGFLRAPEARRAPILLLHCYPFEREAGYLAQAFANVFLDVGLSVNHLGARSTAFVARAFELAPFNKILYSSDGYGPAELHYLGARLWRTALARVLGGFVAADDWSVADAVRIARATGRDNALAAYPRLADAVRH